MKTLITGGTGNVGAAISKLFSRNGIEIKIASRSGKLIDGITNAEAVTFDYYNPETFEAALTDVDSVIVIAPPLDNDCDKVVVPFLELAISKGVQKVVMISAFGVNNNPEAGLTKIENYLINSGIKSAIVRPNFFMENFTTGFLSHSIKADKAFYIAAGESKTAFIASDDIAKFTLEIFNNIEAHNCKGYDIAGKEALTHTEVAALLSKAMGEEIKYIPISSDEMKKGALKNGVPEKNVEMLVALYEATSAGYMEATTEHFKEVTGDEPISFEEFLR